MRGLSQPICNLLPSPGLQAQGQKDKDGAENHIALLWSDTTCVTLHFCLLGRSMQRNRMSLPPWASWPLQPIQMRPWSSLVFCFFFTEVGKIICFSHTQTCTEVTESHQNYVILFSLFFPLGKEMQSACLGWVLCMVRLQWKMVQCP